MPFPLIALPSDLDECLSADFPCMEAEMPSATSSPVWRSTNWIALTSPETSSESAIIPRFSTTVSRSTPSRTAEAAELKAGKIR